jgi:hypothetical protein
MTYDDRDDEISRLKHHVEKLAAQMLFLEQARQSDAHQIQNLAQASALDSVLDRRLEAIQVQLLPLRDLTPARTPLDELGVAKLRELRTDAERPLWNGDPAFERKDWTSAIGRRDL